MTTLFAFIAFFNVFLCLGLGLFTLSRNKKSFINIGFFLGMLCLAVTEAGHAVMMFAKPGERLLLYGIYIAIFGQALLPALWLPFSLSFARVANSRYLLKWTPVFLCFLCVSFAFIYFIPSEYFFYFPAERGSFGKIPIDFNTLETSLLQMGPYGKYFYIYFIVGLVVNIVQLENTFRSSSGSKRWQIKYVIVGVGSILGFYIYIASQAILFLSLNLRMLPAASITVLLSTAMVALFIVRHRLLDVDVFVSRYVVYNSFTVLSVGVYFLCAGVIAKAVNYYELSFSEAISAFIIFASVVFFFVFTLATSVRRKIQLVINRNFFKHKYEFRDKWMESIEKISFVTSEQEIYRVLWDMVAETIPSKATHLWVFQPSANAYTCASENVFPVHVAKIRASHPIFFQIKNSFYPFSILTGSGGGGGELEGELTELLAVTESVLCAPLIAGQDIMGFILLGKDLSGLPYGSDDYEILNALTTQAAVQLQNIRMAQALVTAKEVEAFHKLSSFIVHDIKNLTNSLSLISQNADHNMANPEFQQDTIKTIDHTVSRMKGIISKFSSIPKGLEIKMESVNLTELVKNVLENIKLLEKKKVTVVHEDNGIPSIIGDSHAIEMVLTNLLTNAYDSIDGVGEIWLNTQLENDFVIVSIKDTGSGMSGEYIRHKLFKPFQTTKKGGFGIGLYQCKTTVEAHGGTIEVESKQGQGTIFSIRLKAKERSEKLGTGN